MVHHKEDDKVVAITRSYLNGCFRCKFIVECPDRRRIVENESGDVLVDAEDEVLNNLDKLQCSLFRAIANPDWSANE